MSISIEVSNAWRETFPGARVGVLVIDGVVNPLSHPALEEHARQVEGRLRARFDGADRRALMALPNAKPYVRHYKAFGQNYHVLRQLESVALK